MKKDGGMSEILIPAEPEPIHMDLLKTAVIVVDMQNAFVSKGGYFDLLGYDLSAVQKIIEPCRRIIGIARKMGSKIVYLQMGYSPDLSNAGSPDSPNWFKSKGLRMIRQHPELKEKLYLYGTWGGDIIEELKPRQGDVIIKKQKHDGFIETDLDITLKSLKIKHLVFVGTATNICVESTLRHAFSSGYFSILVSDAVSPIGPSLTQEATLFNVKSTFGWVTISENLLGALRGAPVRFTV